MNDMRAVRVRYAPSPTGYLHIGGARTALFNWLFARRYGGRMILRVEDTDAQRTLEDSVEQIAEQLRWLGLDWDEGPNVQGDYGPYFQSQRLSLYQDAVRRLLDSERAYRCYCTADELAERRRVARQEERSLNYDGRCRLHEKPVEGASFVVRLKTPDEGITRVNDLIHGPVDFDNELVGDFVIVKSDGFPTYNFACVVDDAHMEISHIIRADEHLSNTPKQVWLYEALGYAMPLFAHVPMVLAPDRSKLSKRHGATAVSEFQELGYVPEAIVNYLAFLGWTPEGETEIMDLDQMVAQFSLDDVSHTASIYDVTKLTWMNGHYLRTLPLDDLTKRALPFLEAAGLLQTPLSESEQHRVQELVQCSRERVKTLAEFATALEYFFCDVESYDEKGAKKHFTKPGVAALLRTVAEDLRKLEDYDLENVERVCRELIAREEISAGRLIHPVRLALTGRTAGPGLFHVIWLLGKDKVHKRLHQAVDYIDELTSR